MIPPVQPETTFSATLQYNPVATPAAPYLVALTDGSAAGVGATLDEALQAIYTQMPPGSVVVIG